MPDGDGGKDGDKFPFQAEKGRVHEEGRVVVQGKRRVSLQDKLQVVVEEESADNVKAITAEKIQIRNEVIHVIIVEVDEGAKDGRCEEKGKQEDLDAVKDDHGETALDADLAEGFLVGGRVQLDEAQVRGVRVLEMPHPAVEDARTGGHKERNRRKTQHVNLREIRNDTTANRGNKKRQNKNMSNNRNSPKQENAASQGSCGNNK